MKMKIFYYIYNFWNISVKFFCFISNLNLVLSIFYDFHDALAPQLGQVTPELSSELSSLLQNPQLLQPLAGSSAALTPNFEYSFPHQSVVDSSSWHNLAHQNKHNEHLVAEQNEAVLSEKASDFKAALAPQLGQAPQELSSEFSGLLEKYQLIHPLTSCTATHTSNNQSGFLHQPEISLSWKNLAHQPEIHYENKEMNYQNPMNYYNGCNYTPQFESLNEKKTLNDFLEEGNFNGNTARTNSEAYSSIYHSSNNQNQNWPFDPLVDFDPVDTQFNSMISTYFQTRSPHEQNSNEENIFNSYLNEENLNINTVESLKKNQMPSGLNEEVDNSEISILGSSINQEVPNIFEIQKKVSKISKSKETAKPPRKKRKYDRMSVTKSAKDKEQNTEDSECLEPIGGSINMKLTQKNYLDSLIGTSNSDFEPSYEELKMRLDEPLGTYKLLNFNQKQFKEKQSSTYGHLMNSLLKLGTAGKSVRIEARKMFNNVESKTNFLIDVSSEDPKTRLKALRKILFEQLKLQQYEELTSLDNFVADLYRKAKSKCHPEYVLGSLFDWNVEQTVGQRVNYILKHDKRLREKLIKPRVVKNHNFLFLNNIYIDLIVEAERKMGNFWSLYNKTFRHKYLPTKTRIDKHNFDTLIREIGAFSGENHLKNLNLDKNINQALESILLEIKGKTGQRYKTDSLYQMAKKIALMVSNYIIISYRIFTPFDKKTIEEMQTNLAMTIKNMEEFWMLFLADDCNNKVPKDAPHSNPFTKENMMSLLSAKISRRSVN
ncbi:expressed protein, partial [Phakopsora pachyrhizi]